MNKNFRDPSDQTTGNAKFTVESVRDLRQKYRANQVTVRGIARAYGMSSEGVRRMLRGETWAWVMDAPPPTSDELQQQAERVFNLTQGINAENARTADNLELQKEVGVGLSESARAFLAQARGERGNE